MHLSLWFLSISFFSASLYAEELPAIFVKPRYVIQQTVEATPPSLAPPATVHKKRRRPSSEESIQTEELEVSSQPTTTSVIPETAPIQVEFATEDLHKMVSLYFMTDFIYNNSSSNYSFRDYNSSYNALDMGGKINLGERMGVEASYKYSLGADIDGDDLTRSKSFVKYSEIKSGVFFQTEYETVKPLQLNPVEFKVLYLDKKMILPSDDLHRVSLRSSGFGIGVKTNLSEKVNSLWSLDISFFPNLQHSETETGITLKSGNHKQSSLSEVSLNHILFQNSKNSLFLRLELQVEKNYFDGPASLADPKTGVIPSNVSVTNSSTQLSLGFSWGK